MNKELTAWKPLFKIAGLALYAINFFVVIQIIVYMVSPPPKEVVGFFTYSRKIHCLDSSRLT